MQKRIRVNPVIIPALGIALSALVFFVIQTLVVRSSADEAAELRLNHAEEIIADNDKLTRGILGNYEISNLLNGISVGNTGYVFTISVETGLITSHPNTDIVGTAFAEELRDYGYMKIDGEKVRYRTRTTWTYYYEKYH